MGTKKNQIIVGAKGSPMSPEVETKKKPVNGRNKGSSFERVLCKSFSEWWFPLIDFKGYVLKDLPFQRTPGSGGWNRKIAGGDIQIYSNQGVWKDDFPFCVEAKNREGWEMDNISSFNAKCPVWDWWDQTNEQANDNKRLPLMVFTRNRRPEYVMMWANDFCEYVDKECPQIQVSTGVYEEPVVITTLPEFFKHYFCQRSTQCLAEN